MRSRACSALAPAWLRLSFRATSGFVVLRCFPSAGFVRVCCVLLVPGGSIDTRPAAGSNCLRGGFCGNGQRLRAHGASDQKNEPRGPVGPCPSCQTWGQTPPTLLIRFAPRGPFGVSLDANGAPVCRQRSGGQNNKVWGPPGFRPPLFEHALRKLKPRDSGINKLATHLPALNRRHDGRHHTQTHDSQER